MLNLPNSITISRIFLVIVYTVALAVDGSVSPHINEVTGGWFQPISCTACIALWAFVVAAITDFFDGYLARKYNLVTNLGKLIDPLADKILVSAAFIYLTAAGACPFWVSIIIIFREFLVTGLRQLAVAQGQVIAADKLGKWKTTAQLAYCIACMTQLAYGGNLIEPLRSLSIGASGMWFREILLWVSVILTLWSGLNYCYHGRHLLAR
jgi:CDP-diacylglycerol--glycerol-3-phosphate 3-phosphatidyltransferase